MSTTSPRRRPTQGRAARASFFVGVAVALAVGLGACSSEPPGGGAPTRSSIHHAIYAVIRGLSADDERTFLSAAQSGQAAAELAWSRCEAAVKKGAKPTFPGQDDPRVAYVLVRVPHDEAHSCDIALFWSSNKHWSMTSFVGPEPTN